MKKKKSLHKLKLNKNSISSLNADAVNGGVEAVGVSVIKGCPVSRALQGTLCVSVQVCRSSQNAPVCFGVISFCIPCNPDPIGI